MVKGERLDDKVLEGLDLTRVHSNDIKKFKTYEGTYFTKTSEIRTALQGILKNIDASKEYDGKDIKDIIRKLYDKI